MRFNRTDRYTCIEIHFAGNGHGNGNRYGVAASFGAIAVPVVFVRITAPPSLFQPIIIFAVSFPHLHKAHKLIGIQATVSLIVGYSWVDGHLEVINSPGIGWPLAWKRFVLVVIGNHIYLHYICFIVVSNTTLYRFCGCVNHDDDSPYVRTQGSALTTCIRHH